MRFLKSCLLCFLLPCLISVTLADSSVGVGQDSSASDKPIVIGYTDSKSFFSDKKIQDYLNQGLKHSISFRQYQDRCHLLAAVESGDVDLFYGHMPELYAVSNNNLPYEPLLLAVSSSSDSQVGSQTYNVGIVSYDPKIRSVSDLKGQRVALSDKLSISGNIIPRYLLKAYDIGFKSLDVKTNEEAKKALLKDQVKAASVWWPSTSTVPVQGRVLLQVHGVPNPIIIAKKDFPQKNSDSYALVAKLISFPNLSLGMNYHVFFTYFHDEGLYKAWIQRLTQAGVLGDLCSK